MYIIRIKTKRNTYLLGLCENKKEAKELLKERAELINIVNQDCLIIMDFNQEFNIIRDKLICWLAANDIIGCESDEIINQIYDELEKILKEVY